VSAPQLPLPRWAYLPGVTAEPDREPLERAKALVPSAFPGGVPAEHPAFRYGLALHDAGFFWEAHEVWEAVWKAAPKNGCDRLVVRALIQLVNAKLKLRMGRRGAGRRLLDEAAAEFAEAARRRVASDQGIAASFDIDTSLAEISALRRELTIATSSG
jgi:hypothetical protein